MFSIPMNRKIIVVIVALVLVAGVFFGYRAYKLSADRELARQRAEAQLALIREHEAELARKNAAIEEARRMADAREKEEADRLEKMRAEQAAAEAALAAAQADLARFTAERERLAAEKAAATEESARLAAERELAAAVADAARQAALQKIRDLEQRRAVANRDAARRAALLRQQELEAEAQRLALERERREYEVGGYLVRDFSSIYILKTEHPPKGEEPAAGSEPAKKP
ncbi:MAG: hypothetical protein JWM88_2309 [Verrucomicrobia bacterium]|nr:hypothetical protein [Verrucomicrobiota bacterium]